MQQIILAAGKGSRLKNGQTNKCLVKVLNKRLIDYNIELGEEVGVSEILIVVGHNKEFIIDYLKNDYHGIPIKYIEQKSQRGIAHAVKIASPFINEPFFMCLSDEILFDSQIRGFKKLFEKSKADCICGMVKDDVENIKKAYTLNLDTNNRIYDIVEKPDSVFNDYKGTGYCLMSLRMLNLLPNLKMNPIRNEYEMGDWIHMAILNNYKCYGYEIANADLNINETNDILCAEEYIKNMEV